MSESLWVEKYRPRTVAECILPKKLKTTFQSIIDKGTFQHMLFTGTAGLGKTTVAKAICNELDLDYIMINASNERNIDTLRGKVRQFASSVSLAGGDFKVVILDEADNLGDIFQKALRAFMEEFSDNCRFILTCNFKHKLIEPLHSRCAVYDFNTDKKTTANLCGQFLKRSKEILEQEGITYNEKTVADVIIRYAPDWRRILNELSSSAITGEVTDGTVTTTHTKFNDLFSHLKNKDFKKMRAWVVNNAAADSSSVFRGIYDEMFTYVKNTSIPQLVLILADYQYKAAFAADSELNMVACMTEIMADVEFQ